jgi:hypothetical protein
MDCIISYYFALLMPLEAVYLQKPDQRWFIGDSLANEFLQNTKLGNYL